MAAATGFFFDRRAQFSRIQASKSSTMGAMRSCRRHVQSSARLMSCCRETRVTLLPSASHSATSRSFSSTLQCRCRSTPVMISIRSSALKNILHFAIKIRNNRSSRQGALHRTDTISCSGSGHGGKRFSVIIGDITARVVREG